MGILTSMVRSAEEQTDMKEDLEEMLSRNKVTYDHIYIDDSQTIISGISSIKGTVLYDELIYHGYELDYINGSDEEGKFDLEFSYREDNR